MILFTHSPINSSGTAAQFKVNPFEVKVSQDGNASTFVPVRYSLNPTAGSVGVAFDPPSAGDYEVFSWSRSCFPFLSQVFCIDRFAVVNNR